MRIFLRIVGPIVGLTGLIFAIVGFASFFGFIGAPGVDKAPGQFWMAFVGIPVLVVGLIMTKIGYMGSIVRYLSKEITPVAAESMNEFQEKAEPGIRGAARAIGKGLAEAQSALAQERIRCASCRAGNEPDARYCKGCGRTIES